MKTKIIVALIAMVVLAGVGSAALLTHYGVIDKPITVSQSVLVDGGNYLEPNIYDGEIVAGGTDVTVHTLKNRAVVPATVKFETICTGIDTSEPPVVIDCNGITTTYSTGGGLQVKGSAVAEWSLEPLHSGVYSALLIADSENAGDEARIVINASDVGVTDLNSLNNISWLRYSVSGYAPHVDVIVEVAEGTDALVFEYAYNGHIGDGQPTYGTEYGDWYSTFDDDGEGPSDIDDSALAWLNSGPAGGDDIIKGTLADWKAGSVDGSVTGDSTVLRFEIEIDNWMINSEAYIDDLMINGNAYDLEMILENDPFTLQSGEKLNFYIANRFDVALMPGTYTITTSVNPVLPVT